MFHLWFFMNYTYTNDVTYCNTPNLWKGELTSSHVHVLHIFILRITDDTLYKCTVVLKDTELSLCFTTLTWFCVFDAIFTDWISPCSLVSYWSISKRLRFILSYNTCQLRLKWKLLDYLKSYLARAIHTCKELSTCSDPWKHEDLVTVYCALQREKGFFCWGNV